LDDIIGQLRLVGYEAKSEDLNTEFTDPELHYLFKSGEIKFQWLEGDGLVNQSSLSMLHDVKKKDGSSSYDQGCIDHNIMAFLTKSCKESEDRVSFLWVLLVS
jgi:hypothetical protein